MVADIVELSKNREITSADLTALQSGNPERIFPVFMRIHNRKYIQHFAMVVKNLEKIVDGEVVVCEIKGVSDYFVDHLACQMLHGDIDVLLGISGDDDALLYLAGRFSKMEFDKIDMDSYDALCELTNCINGNFATLLEESCVEVEIETPTCCDDCHIRSDAQFYVLRLRVDGKEVEIISVIDVIAYMS